MKKYEILEHKADLKLRAFGKTKKELFSNMLLAMADALQAKTKDQKLKTKNIKVKSSDLSSLLVDFLSEALYLIQVDKVLYNKVKFRDFTDTEIEAELTGQKVESFGEEIKAVTYHNLDIHQEKDGTWQATVLFDI
jgi:SHS2 domain-containing protein